MSVQTFENPRRDLAEALRRGVRQKCPNCGEGHLYSSYLKVMPACGQCSEELHHHRADDAPPYFTILLVGHLIVPLALYVETFYRPPLWVHAAMWLPTAVIAALLSLPVIKGALVALQWALYMHGFDKNGLDVDPD